MSELLNRAITKLSACVATGDMARFEPAELKALLAFYTATFSPAQEHKETAEISKPVIIGMPGVFVSKGNVWVFLTYDRDHDVSMSMIAHQAKKLLMEIASGKVD
jgi:hypothetical protein